MNTGGVVFVTLSWGFIISLAVFCFYKVFSKKKV